MGRIVIFDASSLGASPVRYDNQENAIIPIIPIIPGKLFQAGYFPDKQFSLTEGEIAAEVARYNALLFRAQMNLEHRQTVLDGAPPFDLSGSCRRSSPWTRPTTGEPACVMSATRHSYPFSSAGARGTTLSERE